ncbi:UNVERIFIED_CONTAM: hypothetical protein PYX00_004720 [Menopon gallinae]
MDKSVDFVLVWLEDNKKNGAENKRTCFEGNLANEGLELTEEVLDKFHFVKIHAPTEVLARYCEILKLKMPIKVVEEEEKEEEAFDLVNEVKGWFRMIISFIDFDKKIFPTEESKLTAEFARDKDYLFDIDSPNFFTSTVKSCIIDFILERQRYTDNPSAVYDVGINQLLLDGVYAAAYPLHDGDYRRGNSLRSKLYREWSTLKNWIKIQPIDQIKDYFGIKHALYFAWLGFYTHMLIPASIIGLLCFIYGWITLYNNKLSEDICKAEDIVMCPLCDETCDYWKLSETCTFARLEYLFDNPATIFFATFMSFWSTLYLELWKRHSSALTHRWGLATFDLSAEPPRPGYLASVSSKYRKFVKEKVNVITQLTEPYVPFWKIRVPNIVLSFSIVLLLISTAIGAVFAVVFYRMSAYSAFSFFYSRDDQTSYTYTVIVIPTTAAVINLICVTILNYVYDKLAVYLTELELLRTQTEFEDSLTLKIYLFQFVNYYTSIFYIAFLKGKFVGYPSKYNRIFGFRQEECSPGGCLVELCIQLAIIMVGKQTLNSILEMVVPLFYKMYKEFRVRTGLKKEEFQPYVSVNQWTEDYKLLDWGPRGLFVEYLEMIIQYGFITIFVAAFPLAPLFALINNILEMRLDAQKFLKFYRRPVPRRVKNIGVWYTILDVLNRISVITNALIIAFSTNFIPRLVYMMIVSEDHSDTGFLNYTLAYFDTKDFEVRTGSHSRSPNVTMCRYSEYREPPWADRPYKKTLIFWHILAARLAFIVVFQNVVSFVTLAIDWLIPDISRKLKDEMKKETFLTNEIIIKQERDRAMKQRSKSPVVRERKKLGRNGALNDRRHTGDWHSQDFQSNHVESQL